MAREEPRESSCPAADFQYLSAPARDLSQEKGVVMAVVVPTLIGDLSEPIKVILNLSHRRGLLGHDELLSKTSFIRSRCPDSKPLEVENL
jgi:hypothetical protein